jgi:hypothetical protein
MYLLKHGLGVMVHNQDVVNISKDISVITVVVERVNLSFKPKVGVGFTGCISHLLHKERKVCSESCTDTLESIQSSNNDGVQAEFGFTKFGSKDGPHFLCNGSSDVGVHNVPVFTSRLLRAALVKAMQTVSRETMLA